MQLSFQAMLLSTSMDTINRPTCSIESVMWKSLKPLTNEYSIYILTNEYSIYIWEPKTIEKWFPVILIAESIPFRGPILFFLYYLDLGQISPFNLATRVIVQLYCGLVNLLIKHHATKKGGYFISNRYGFSGDVNILNIIPKKRHQCQPLYIIGNESTIS